MVRLEPQHERIPDDVLARAKDLGQKVQNRQDLKDAIAIQSKGGFYYCEAVRWEDIVRVKILDFTADFLCHPRSGGLRKIPFWDNESNIYTLTGVYGGGYRPKTSGEGYDELESRQVYPLVDQDKGTWGVKSEDIECEWSAEEDYGNIWWIGEDESVLSWKGPPNRHWNVGSNIRIDGLSRTENIVNQKEYYTMFDVYIYEGGEKLCQCPTLDALDIYNSLVVGACRYKETLFCMTVSRDESYWLYVWKSSDNGINWKQVGDRVGTSRAYVPCFISKYGNKFVF